MQVCDATPPGGQPAIQGVRASTCQHACCPRKADSRSCSLQLRRQNSNLAINCASREEFACELTVPKLELPNVVPIPPNSVWLVTL